MLVVITIGKVVASHFEGCKIESRLWLSYTYLYYERGTQGVLPIRVGGGCDQSIGSTVSECHCSSLVDCNKEFPIGLLQ